jgi:hypothetical protein
METIKVIFSGLVGGGEYGAKLGERYKAIPGFATMFGEKKSSHTVDVSMYGLTSGDLIGYLKCLQGEYIPEICPFGIVQLAIHLQDDIFVENYGDRVDISMIADLSKASEQSKMFVLVMLISSIKKDKGFKIVHRIQRPKWRSFLTYDFDDLLSHIPESSDQTISKRWRACIASFTEHPLASFFWGDSPKFRKLIVSEFHVSSKKHNSCLKNETLSDLKKWISIQISPVSRSQVDNDIETEATRLYNQRVGYLKQYTSTKSLIDVFDTESDKDIQHGTIWAECLRTAKSNITKKRNDDAHKFNY